MLVVLFTDPAITDQLVPDRIIQTLNTRRPRIIITLPQLLAIPILFIKLIKPTASQIKVHPIILSTQPAGQLKVLTEWRDIGRQRSEEAGKTVAIVLVGSTGRVTGSSWREDRGSHV